MKDPSGALPWILTAPALRQLQKKVHKNYESGSHFLLISTTCTLVKCNLQIYHHEWEILSYSQTLSKRTRWGGLFDNIGYDQHLKPIISKGHSKAFFLFFHQIFFLAFNSRDITMLWVLNLFSRSSPTKLWKRIFDLKSEKNVFDIYSGLLIPKL